MKTWEEVWEMRQNISMHINKAESNDASGYESEFRLSIMMHLRKICC